MRANLGLGTTELRAPIRADQENPPTGYFAAGTAFVTNDNIVTHTFDISMTVNGIKGNLLGVQIRQGT